MLGGLGASGCGGDPPSIGSDAGPDAGPDASGNSPDAGIVCEPGPLAIDPNVLPACNLCSGTLARCVPGSLLPEGSDVFLADCPDTPGSKCVPDHFVETGGSFLLETCTSVQGAEGRCLPDCIPDVAAQASFLPQDICDAGWLCAPCYDPTTGEDTGACRQGCDPGPNEPPITFDRCCGDRGACVPTALVPASQIDQLGVDTCTDPGTLCAPDDLTVSTYIPPSCVALGGTQEGRCLPDCLPSIAAQASLLDRGVGDVCVVGDLCAPCYDPTTGADTGACTLNGDTPTDPAPTVEACCGDRGVCLSPLVIPDAQESQLGADTCGDAGDLCAPTALSDPAYTPPSCVALGGTQEGRCLPDCLPSIAAQASLLDRGVGDVCVAGDLCAPCYDPTTGADTGACTLNGDTPTDPAPTVEACCGDRGVCLAPAVIPDAQESQLGADTCGDAGDLCAPTALADPSYQPMMCSSIGGGEGRCLPDCLPDVAAQADRLPQDICVAGDLCAPCYDPITGADTGACTLNGDSPNEPPFVFERCCSLRGSCVPTSLVPPDQLAQLGADTCADPAAVCAPDDLVDPAYIPPTCASIGGAEGRCLPDCLPDIAAQAGTLPQSTCAVGELCAPCYDPITGENSGACTLNGDAPTEPAYVFGNCCLSDTDVARGRCVPPEAIPDSQESALVADDCTDPNLCVPNPFLTDPNYQFASCTRSFGQTGGCVPDCLVDPLLAWTMAQWDCQNGELCAPCTNPLTGEPTGACN